MPLREPVQRTTFLRRLPFTTLSKLSMLLDPVQPTYCDWKGLAGRIPRSPTDDQPRYGPQEIAMFELEYRRPGGSPTMALITDWGTINATVQDLLDILIDMGHFAAAEVLLPGITANLNPVSSTTVNQGEYQSGMTAMANLDLNSSLDSIQQAKSFAHQPHKSETRESGCEEVSSSTESTTTGLSSHKEEDPCDRKPCEGGSDFTVSTSAPTESSDLPDFEPNKVKEYGYTMLSNMTDSFNDVPLSQGGNMVGEGGFGTVYLGRFGDGHECAIKKLKQSVFQCSDVDVLKQYQTELQMLQRLKHKNLVELYGFSFDGPSPCLVFQYVQNGSLLRVLNQNSTLHLPWVSRVHVARGTAEGLCYLHEQGTVHRDVKSANVLLDKDFTPKVADFGLVRAIPEGNDKTHITSMIIGTNIYMPPEARFGEVSSKGDTFSFGVVLLELLTGLEPLDLTRQDPDIITHVEVFLDKCESDILKIVDPRLHLPFEKEASARSMYDIATDCLERKQKRPLLTEVLSRLLEL